MPRVLEPLGCCGWKMAPCLRHMNPNCQLRSNLEVEAIELERGSSPPDYNL